MSEIVDGLPFEVNQKVSFPGFGIATFNGTSEESYSGISETLCKFTFANGTRRYIPVKKLSEQNIRGLSSKKIIAEVIAVLKSRRKSTKTRGAAGWAKMELALKTKLVSGELSLVAEVVRDLHEDNPEDRSGFGRISLYAQGMKTLLEEIAAIKGISREDALAFLKKESGKALYDQKWNTSEALLMKVRQPPTPPKEVSAEEPVPEPTPLNEEKVLPDPEEKPLEQKAQKGDPGKLRKVREARAKKEAAETPSKPTEPKPPSAGLEKLQKELAESQSSLVECEQALEKAKATAEAKSQRLFEQVETLTDSLQKSSEELAKTKAALESEQANSAELAAKVREQEELLAECMELLDIEPGEAIPLDGRMLLKDGFYTFPEWEENEKAGS